MRGFFFIITLSIFLKYFPAFAAADPPPAAAGCPALASAQLGSLLWLGLTRDGGARVCAVAQPRRDTRVGAAT